MTLLLLLPALAAGAAAATLASRPAAAAGRRGLLVAALGAVAVAALAPDGPWERRALLLGLHVGLDPAGRAGLLLAAGLLLPLGRWRSQPAAGGALAWRALLGSGLAAMAVAHDAGLLAAGHVALVFGAYGLVAKGPGGARAAARFMALAVTGEVLLVDALSEFGHAAESARLDAMRLAAGGELGPLAPLLLACAYGLPLGIIGLSGPAVPAIAIAAAGLVALSRLAQSPGGAGLLALAMVAFAAVAAAIVRLVDGARARWPRAGQAPAHLAEETAAGPEAAPALTWLGAAEHRLGELGGSGALLLLLCVILALLLAASS